MHRRHFIKSIAVTGFANLFLPKAMDRYKWFRTGRIIDPTPVFKAPAYQGKWVFVVEKFPLRFELDGTMWRQTIGAGFEVSSPVTGSAAPQIRKSRATEVRRPPAPRHLS